MRSRLHRIGRGRLIAAATVIVTAVLLVGVARIVFSHPIEAANEPGIVMTGKPSTTSSQSSTSSSAEPEGGASVSGERYAGSDVSGLPEDQGTGGTEDGLPAQEQAPQPVDPEPPIAVDNGGGQDAPASPAGSVVTERRAGDSDDDDDKKTSAAVSKDGDSDEDGDGDDD